MDVDNLISGSSAFSKTTLNIRQFTVHVLLKPCLENFEHYLDSMWNACNVWWFQHSLTFPFFGIGMKTDIFQSCGHCWLFQICWYNECSTLKATSFKIWNSSAGISLPPLALFVVCPCWIVTPGQLMGFRAANGNGEMGVPSAPGCDTTSAPAFPRPSSQPLQQGLLLNSWLHVTDSQWPVKV